MSKTLHDTIKNLKCNIKVGAINGSSFFFCSKAPRLYKDIDKIEEKATIQNKKKIKQLKTRLDNLDTIYTRITNSAIKNPVKYGQKWLEQRLRALEKIKAKEQKELPIKISVIKENMNIPLLKRQVVEIHEGISVDEQPCKVIYVKGVETGAYWSVYEYEKRRNKVWFK